MRVAADRVLPCKTLTAWELARMDREIISRSEAKAHGLKRYFTGHPCSKGHVESRYTADRICSECKRQAKAAHEAKQMKNPGRATFLRDNLRAIKSIEANMGLTQGGEREPACEFPW